MFMNKAEELGRLIGQADEYKAIKRAEQTLDQAAELRLKMSRLEQLARDLEQQVASNKEPTEELAAEYEKVFGEIQGDPRYQQLVAAQANFDKLMLRVQERIMEGMQKGAESSIITLS